VGKKGRVGVSVAEQSIPSGLHTELIDNKNPLEAERLLLILDKRMLDLIEATGGLVYRE
jgi:hypothetical protein